MRIYTAVLTAALAVSASPLISTAHAASSDEWQRDPASVTTGSCTIKKTEYALAANSEDQSTSTTFVNLGDAGAITFNQKKTGCVAGTFFANAGNTSTGTDHVRLQVLLDNVSCTPLGGGYRFANTGTDFSSHAAAFFCGASVATGRRTIQVQYSSELGANVQIFQRTLEVTHD
ncbi:MAG: hypothetical protein ACREHV_14240 [Rhizomicrobium sp.]